MKEITASYSVKRLRYGPRKKLRKENLVASGKNEIDVTVAR